jgi:hypothetical protein
MNKPEVEILIVDDDRDRDPIYTQFFNRLSAEPDSSHIIVPLLPKTPSEALSFLRSRRPCLIVLDMVLEGDWQKSVLMIYQTIKTQRYAVALLSNNFNDATTGVTTTGVLVELASVPKLGFLPYAASIQKFFVRSVGRVEDLDAIPGDTVLVWNCMLAEALGHGGHWRPATKGEVTFLHLTDTHFGPVQPDFLNVVGMESATRDAGLQADYILWTGDITEHGYPKEFDAANVFAMDIKKAKFIGKSCPISVTPGNHDFCRPLALSSRLEWVDVAEATVGATPTVVSSQSHFDDQKAERKRKEWKVRDHSVVDELARYGLAPFNEFVTRVVGEPNSKEGYRLLTHWAHLGFAILELPLEAHTVSSRSDQTDLPQPFISDLTFKNITNKAIESFRAADLHRLVCVIILIHARAPDNGQTKVVRWKDLVARICEFGNPVIILGGHEHANDHVPYKNRLTIIGAPLDEHKTTGGLTLPGVGFIRLSGLRTEELRCDVTKLQKSADDGGISKWGAATPRKFSINPLTSFWIDAAS